jgi:hypothetical protein
MMLGFTFLVAPTGLVLGLRFNAFVLGVLLLVAAASFSLSAFGVAATIRSDKPANPFTPVKLRGVASQFPSLRASIRCRADSALDARQLESALQAAFKAGAPLLYATRLREPPQFSPVAQW